MKIRDLGASVLLFAAIPLFGQDAEPLGDIARQMRAEKESTLPQEKRAVQARAVPVDEEGPKDGGDFAALVARLNHTEQFEALDQLAATVRSQKSRFPGGGWKLYAIYMSVCWQACDSEAQTVNAIRRLKRWIAARPDSVTARIALADAYVAYAWNARGDGYAYKVSPDGWKPFEERMLLAEQTLKEAAELPMKCPHWYFVAEKIGRSRGWKLEDLNRSAEEALEFEPLYYYTYQEHVLTLEPKWYGKAGDPERYAERVADKIGGKLGDIIYFEIATSLFHCRTCEETNSMFAMMSWPRIQRGYAIEETLYGLGRIKLNEFAYLACRAGDRLIAHKLFERIGDDWMADTWQTRSNFDAARSWAVGP